MKLEKLPVIAATSALMIAPATGIASGHEELELEVAYLYFELNDTDGDLGIHGKGDGDAWKKMSIEGPEGDSERTLLKIRTRSGLRRQGLTEIFFESAEPTFDELDPEVFFPRFPEGAYEWEGRTLDNQEIEGEVWLSHIIPAAPVVTGVGDETENPGFEIEIDDEGEAEVAKACWEAELDDSGNVVVSWDAVTMSHFDTWNFDLADQPLLPGEVLRYGGEDQPERKIPLGVSGQIQDVLYYEFVAEIDDTEYKSTAVVTPETTSWAIPGDFIMIAEPDDEGVREIKFEIIVRVETGEQEYLDDGEVETVESRPGNQSAVEDCFEIEIVDP